MYLPRRNKIDKKKKINFTIKYTQKIDRKPNGFWYSCYNNWYKWVSKEMPEWLYTYIHKINIHKNVLTDIRNKDKNKLLVIHNIKDFDIFTKKYGMLDEQMIKYHNTHKMSKYISKKNWAYVIDWIQVSKDYGGIEICPFFTERSNYIWYEWWSVASGCIWNTEKIIKNLDLIYEKKKGKYTKIL